MSLEQADAKASLDENTTFLSTFMRSIRRRPRKWLLVAFSAFLCLAFFFFLPRDAGSEMISHSTTSAGFFGTAFNRITSRPPKITIIVIWMERGQNNPTYLPYFFQSVAANPEIDLLFINVDKEYKGCTSFARSANVQEVCLNERQYWQLHVDFLCNRWKCTDEDKKVLLRQLISRTSQDANNSFFRILRNGVFSKWIDPATTIWGWCDADTYWGNFTRTFPWDIAGDFDVLAPAGQPEFSDQRLLFTRGHMAFFKNTPEILSKMHDYEKFSSLAAFLSSTMTRVDAEESEFSHYYFSDNEDFRFLAFEGMVNSYDSVFVSERGVFYAPLKKDAMTLETRKQFIPLVYPSDRRRPGPTFSEDGEEKKTRFFSDGRYYNAALWFDKKFATFVETGWNTHEREQKAYFMRRTPGGRVTQRIEPRGRYVSRAGGHVVDESLYKHWQGEKREPWFHKLPKEGLKPGQIMAMYHSDEIDIWDLQGNVIFESGKNH